MDFANTSFLDIVAEGKAAILVTRIEQVTTLVDGADQTHQGVLHPAVLRELTPNRWRGERRIEVAFLQYKEPHIRALRGDGGWNDVEAKTGAYLLVAIPAPAQQPAGTGAPATTYVAVAVAPLASVDDPMVASVEKALAIEATQDPDRRLALIRDGLGGRLEFLREYCHYAAGRLKRIPRKDAVKLETALLVDANRPSAERMAAQANLELELWNGANPEDPANKSILEAYFAAFTAGDKELRRALVLAIYNALVSDAPEDAAEADSYRRKLMSDVRRPSEQVLQPILRELESDQDLATEATWIGAFLSGS